MQTRKKIDNNVKIKQTAKKNCGSSGPDPNQIKGCVGCSAVRIPEVELLIQKFRNSKEEHSTLKIISKRKKGKHQTETF